MDLLEKLKRAQKQNVPKARYNVVFLKKLFAPTKNVCKGLQQIFLQDTMEPKILGLFNCILHKRKLN